MNTDVLIGLLIPFIGTTAGSACVLFMKRELNRTVQRALTGFAAGVMVAASIWSLLIPSMDQSEHMGKFAFVPAVVGFFPGIAFLLILDMVIPHLHMNSDTAYSENECVDYSNEPDSTGHHTTAYRRLNKSDSAQYIGQNNRGMSSDTIPLILFHKQCHKKNAAQEKYSR